MDRLARLFDRLRWPLGALVVAATITAIWANHFADPSREVRVETSQADQFRNEVDFQFHTRGSGVLLVLEADDMLSPDGLAAMRRVQSAVEDLEHVARVVTLDDVPRLDNFPLVAELLPEDLDDADAVAAARPHVLDHPLIMGQMLSPDARTLLSPVFIAPPVAAPRDFYAELIETIDRAATTAAGDTLRVGRTGHLPLRQEQIEAFDRDHAKFQWIAYTLVFVLAAIMFRGVAAVFIVASAPAMGLYWTLGALRFIPMDQNPLVDIILPVLIVMVGFTNGVHLMVDIRRLRASGLPPREAAAGAIRHLATACFLTSLTTAVGFGSLMIADSHIIRDFGLASTIGVTINFFAVLIIVPLLSSTPLARRVHAGHEHDVVNKNLTLFEGLINYILRHARLVTALGILGTITLAAIASTLRPDSRMSADFPSHSPAYQALAQCDAAFGGIETVQLVIDWPEDAELGSPEFLEVVREGTAVFDGEPLVSHPFSILALLDALPAGENRLSEFLALTALVPDAKQVIARVLRTDLRRAVVLGKVQDLGSARYLPVFERIDGRLAKIESAHPGYQLRLTGDPVTRGRTLHEIIYDLAFSLSLASSVILIVMGVAYRSLRIGLLCVVPNLFPLAVTAALLVLLNRPLEITSVCAFTICLGIAVDDTIHFLSRFQLEQRGDGLRDPAIRRSFLRVGSALILSSVVLVAGFGSVLTSELPGNRVFAAMACSTIAAALLGDLIILPAMLSCFMPNKALPRPQSSGDSIDEATTDEPATRLAEIAGRAPG